MPPASPITAKLGINDKNDASLPSSETEPIARPMATIPKPVER